MATESVVRLEGGKYEVRHSNGTGLRALRYGEPWRDMTGDGLVLALVHRIEELESRAANVADAALLARLREVAYRDEAKGVTVRAEDLRALLEAARPTLVPEMLREMQAHVPFAVAKQGNVARWEWEANYLNAALCEPTKPCACCGVTPQGDFVAEPAGEAD